MKNKIVSFILVSTLLVTMFSVIPSASNAQDNNNTNSYMWMNNNFWDTGIIYNETVVIYQPNSGEANGYLIFNPTQIVSVKSYDLNTTYTEGQDYIISGNKITLTANSRIKTLTQDEYFPSDNSSAPYGAYKNGGGNILYTEGSYLVDKQIAVTYRFDKSQWTGPQPKYDLGKLSKIMAKLTNKQNIEEVVIGDSIGTGCNSSSFLGIQPYMPSWYDLVKQKLETDYGASINIDNFSKGGQTSQYGVTQANVAAAKHPDLAVIEYGMNDGTYSMTTGDYQANIISMINTIRASAPDCEFILCAPTLANPDSIQCGTQESYISVLNSISSTMSGIAVADFTTMNQAMLVNNKRYFDLSANDINHPNDFMQTAMAANIIDLFNHSDPVKTVFQQKFEDQSAFDSETTTNNYQVDAGRWGALASTVTQTSAPGMDGGNDKSLLVANRQSWGDSSRIRFYSSTLQAGKTYRLTVYLKNGDPTKGLWLTPAISFFGADGTGGYPGQSQFGSDGADLGYYTAANKDGWVKYTDTFYITEDKTSGICEFHGFGLGIQLTGCHAGYVVTEFYFVTPGGNTALDTCPYYMDNLAIYDISDGADPENVNQLINFGTHKVSTNNTITNIEPQETVGQIKSDIIASDTTNTSLKIFNGSSDITANDNQQIGTGTVLSIYVGGIITDSYTLRIYGDVNGDGSVDLNDLTDVRDHILGTSILDGNFKSAGDLYGEQNITLNDLVGIMAYISNNGNINQNN